MPNKNKRKAPEGLREGINTRADILFVPDSVREDDNSVEFVLTTEYPATIFDWNRFEYVKEVLRADGVQLPSNKQVPLLNSHDRSRIENILGSVRDIRTEGDKVVGRLYFSKAPAAQEAFEKVKEGHLDSGSVGYSQEQSQWIDKDETVSYNGKDYSGPMLLTTAFALKEYSLVAVGADPFAKSREEAPVIEAKEEPTQETTSREAVDNICKENTMENKTNIEQPQTIDTEAIRAEAVKAEQTRAAKISELCERHDVKEMASRLIAEGATIESAQDKILDTLAARTTAVANAVKPEIEMGKEAVEKMRDAATDGLILRSGMRIEKPAEGANNFRGMGFTEIARECLELSGVSTRGMDKTKILERALSVSDFSNVLANVANKSVMIGYQAAPSTWRLWAKQGILPDFKSSKRIKLSDAPDMLEVIEGDEIKEGVISDQGEAISLSTFARKLVITRQALINDDTGLFNSLFRAFGFRAANLIEATAYGILTNNAAMADGGNLFNTTAVTTAGGHANMAASGAALSATTATAAEVAIMNQTGPNGMKLSLMPSMILTGSAYKIAASLLVNSTTDTTLTGNANYNPFNELRAVASAHIPGNKWYMIANPNQIDTVEMAFLNGKDTPTLYQVDNDGDILGRKFVGYIDIGAKALDFRGMFYNAGA